MASKEISMAATRKRGFTEGVLSTLSQNSDTLNLDISLTIPMPEFTPDNLGVIKFIRGMGERSSMPFLAKALESVFKDEGKRGFLLIRGGQRRAYRRLVADFASTLEQNASLLNRRILNSESHGFRSETTIGELVFTAYEDLAKLRANREYIESSVRPRTEVLARQPGFKFSPRLERVNQGSRR